MASLAVAVLLLAGCRQQGPMAADVVAQVAGESLLYGAFEEFLSRQVGDGAAGLDSEVLSRLLDQFLDEELLLRLAVSQERVAPGSSRRRAVDALLGDIEEVVVSEAEVARHYVRHAEEFRLPERVVLYHLQVMDEQEATDARQLVLAGAEFAEVAQEVLRDPATAHGGFQGEIALEDLPFPFAQRIAALEVGEVSDVISAAHGYHLFLVAQRLPEEQLALEEVAEEIAQSLRRHQGDQRLAALVAEARNHYNVEVYAQNLPFHYQGDYHHEPHSPAPSR